MDHDPHTQPNTDGMRKTVAKGREMHIPLVTPDGHPTMFGLMLFLIDKSADTIDALRKEISDG